MRKYFYCEFKNLKPLFFEIFFLEYSFLEEVKPIPKETKQQETAVHN